MAYGACRGSVLQHGFGEFGPVTRLWRVRSCNMALASSVLHHGFGSPCEASKGSFLHHDPRHLPLPALRVSCLAIGRVVRAGLSEHLSKKDTAVVPASRPLKWLCSLMQRAECHVRQQCHTSAATAAAADDRLGYTRHRRTSCCSQQVIMGIMHDAQRA
jgi:hypothetical protein